MKPSQITFKKKFILFGILIVKLPLIISKKLLCSSPVLAATDFTKPFKLEVDASGPSVGAVLLQEDDHGIEHTVCFYYKKFNRHQLNYSAIEKEALALLLALQQFEVYIGSSSQPV